MARDCGGCPSAIAPPVHDNRRRGTERPTIACSQPTERITASRPPRRTYTTRRAAGRRCADDDCVADDSPEFDNDIAAAEAFLGDHCLAASERIVTARAVIRRNRSGTSTTTAPGESSARAARTNGPDLTPRPVECVAHGGGCRLGRRWPCVALGVVESAVISSRPEALARARGRSLAYALHPTRTFRRKVCVA